MQHIFTRDFVLQQFANQAENIFRQSNRRSNLEKAYTELVRTIFDQIVRVANEHPKTPREVVMLGEFWFQ